MHRRVVRCACVLSTGMFWDTCKTSRDLLYSALPLYGRVCRSFAIGVICLGQRLPPPNPLVHKNAKIPTRVLASATLTTLDIVVTFLTCQPLTVLSGAHYYFIVFRQTLTKCTHSCQMGVGDFNTPCLVGQQILSKEKDAAGLPSGFRPCVSAPLSLLQGPRRQA